MSADVLALCMALACNPAGADTVGPRVRDRFAQERPKPQVEDRWLAIDKVQHFAMAYGVAMFGYGILRGADVAHEDAQTAALAGSLALGVTKEIFDRSRGGPFSLKDLAWDTLGALAAWRLLSLNR